MGNEKAADLPDCWTFENTHAHTHKKTHTKGLYKEVLTDFVEQKTWA
jgi:hypothetical protein